MKNFFQWLWAAVRFIPAALILTMYKSLKERSKKK
jgi:hypothetical protein